MTIRHALDHAAARLRRAGIESSGVEAELLLEHVLEIHRLRLVLNSSESLASPAAAAFEQLISRRATRVPLQHLTGWAPFLNHRVQVTRDTFIPRPETEQLALLAMDHLRCLAAGRPDAQPIGVLDFGTGTGCLALALAAAVPTARVTAVELSTAAASVARWNIARGGVVDRVEVVEGDGFLVLPALGRLFDLIVTNPPYIPDSEIDQLDPEVRDHDPRAALGGGTDGLDYFRRLAAVAGKWLVAPGCLIAEFGDGQATALTRLFADGGWNGIRVEKDLSGRGRVLIVRRPPAA